MSVLYVITNPCTILLLAKAGVHAVDEFVNGNLVQK